MQRADNAADDFSAVGKDDDDSMNDASMQQRRRSSKGVSGAGVAADLPGGGNGEAGAGTAGCGGGGGDDGGGGVVEVRGNSSPEPVGAVGGQLKTFVQHGGGAFHLEKSPPTWGAFCLCCLHPSESRS